MWGFESPPGYHADLARLQGVRLLATSTLNENEPLDQAAIKRLAGGMEYLRTGLRSPQVVLDAIREYRDEETGFNSIKRWSDQQMIAQVGKRVQATDAFQNRIEWCRVTGCRQPDGQKRFSGFLQSLGIRSAAASEYFERILRAAALTLDVRTKNDLSDQPDRPSVPGESPRDSLCPGTSWAEWISLHRKIRSKGRRYGRPTRGPLRADHRSRASP